METYLAEITDRVTNEKRYRLVKAKDRFDAHEMTISEYGRSYDVLILNTIE